MSQVLPSSVPSGMPKGIPAKPAAENFEPPVAWLFGRQLIAGLKSILLYAAFKGKLDPRDWMKANVIELHTAASRAEAAIRPTGQESAVDESLESFWFDYIADSGDGQKAVYTIAYLCMSDLAVSTNPQSGDQVHFVTKPDAVMAGGGQMLLPRGTFLFVGGDTSYHIADYSNLASRFQNPFCWAAKDLFDSGAESVKDERRHPLVGIPGNHDYYDSLDGFNRQFRRPATGERVIRDRSPLLAIPTFSRKQEASYLALRLPFDWWFWGMDTEEGEIDFRQLEFFQNIQEEHNPKRLIVATPEPTTVFGKFAEPKENASKTFAALDLKRPFLRDAEPMEPGKCRLDLSGDVHHYARHWGAPKDTNQASNYASVMSGGGGAFFHPSHTTIKELNPTVLYPTKEASRREVAGQLFKFTNIRKGGYVWLAGFVIAFSLFFAASFPQSSKDAIDTFPLFTKLSISPRVGPDIQRPISSYVQQMPRNPWWTDPREAPNGYKRAAVFLILSVGLLIVALVYSGRLFKTEYDPKWSTPRKKVTLPERLPIWIFVFGSFGLLSLSVYYFRINQQILTSFGRSFIVFFALLWSVLAIAASLKYSEWLFQEVYSGNLKAWHYWPVWVLDIMSVLAFGGALWIFGRQEARLLISDLTLILMLVLVGGGLMFFACSTGGSLKKGARKLAYLPMGAFHALLQLAVPFLLIRKGHLFWAPLATIILIVIFKYIGRVFSNVENGWPLAIFWVLFGAGLLLSPFILKAETWPVFFPGELLNVSNSRFVQFLLCFYAGIVGAVMSCVLFGWYLAVALAFNAHNNEAGGAARIEKFKQFIRFRLDRNGLTGYVIAIDEPATEGGNGKLSPKVVDVFRISEQQPERANP